LLDKSPRLLSAQNTPVRYTVSLFAVIGFFPRRRIHSPRDVPR